MTPTERRHLAEQILTNPLLDVLFDEMEQSTINQCINANPCDDLKRGAYAAEVRAIRSFRSNLQAELEDTQPRKGAPA